jgi:hypothetical protein
MAEIIPLTNGLPSFCRVYGHSWNATGNMPGQHRCTICKEIGYCASCIVAVPANATVMVCQKHQTLNTDKEASHG